MDPKQLVFGISSDEEAPTWEDMIGDDDNWFTEVLGAVDMGFDDPDEVVFVREVKPSKKSKPSKLRSQVFDDNDDCFVLNGDPRKPLDVSNEEEEDEDELQIVGQNGEIACRDLPHSRHLCAKFKFSSTPHEKHCELCHCYVCDTHAPCVYWGSGTSNTNDHCHATDEEERWNTLRKSFRTGKNAPMPVSNFPLTPPMEAAHLNDVPLSDVTHVAPRSTSQNQVSSPVAQDQVSRPIPLNRVSWSTPQNQVSRPITIPAGNFMPQNQISRSTTVHACSSPNRDNTRNSMSQTGSRQSQIQELVSKRIKLQSCPRLVSQRLLGPRSTSIQKDRGQGIDMVSQFFSSNTMPKRVNGGVAAATAVNRTAYGSSESITSHAAQHAPNSAAVATTNDSNPIGWENLGSATTPEMYMVQSSSQVNMGSVFTNTAPSQPALYSQPIPQSNGDQSINLCGGFPDFDFGLVNNSGQSDHQPPTEIVQLQTTGSTNEQLSIKEFDNCTRFHFEDDLNFLFDFEDQPFPVVQDGCIPPEPPEPVSFDTGMRLFDFEPLGLT
ncbi:hypothetical protein SLEP1_g14218 [Rubroshorea leprosula]|uniref:RPM1 interacting protein 13 n=1 Tax=Rubroshorea leprosula TaxID=152421 RepID=A0AAV5IP92_9ROSI|nr:hypothetical protein SLEP1_g14218 [Rubroshorea leprosula]